MGFRKIVIVFLCLFILVPVARADVKTEERTKVEFPGLLGGFMKFFGGKSARDGIVEKIALKGDRKMVVNEDTAQLIDLGEEKVYQIDMKKKTYTVMTFEEMRQQMQEALDRAKAEMAKNPPPNAPPPSTGDQQEPQVAVDFKLNESGQKKTINGYDCREIVMTATIRQKDKTADDGAMQVSTSIWMAPRIEAMKELQDFDLRFAQKLALPFAQEMAQQMMPAIAAYPGLKDAMGKIEVEKVKMDGTAILTEVHADVLGNPDQANGSKPAAKPAETKQNDIPKSLGGLLGGLGKKAVTRKEDNSNANKGADSGKPPSLMTSTTELISVSTSVGDSDVAIPAGFKEVKK